jgi:hypothetical protein
MAIADLIVRLKDEASAGLRGVRGALSGLGSSASQAAGQTQGLVGAISQGVLQANAIQFAIGKATEAIGFMNSKFEEAKNLQLANVTAATTFSSLTGQSYDDAAKFVENLNNRLAKSAAALPGATQDYKNLAIAIQDNVLEAFKDPSGKLNQKGFEDTLASISESFGALSAASNVATGNTTLGLSKALGGASTSELRQIQFFEQNAVILNEIDKRLKAMGKSALKDLDIKARVKLLEDVGKKFITEDFKKNAGQTVDALMQSFQSTLFDPSTGVFGIMRDLDINTDGVQSAFGAFNDSLKLLIGNDGLFTKFGTLMDSLGLSVDPMRVLRDGVLLFNNFLTRVNQQVDQINTFIKVTAEALRAGTVSISDVAFTVVNNIGSFLGKAAGAIVPALESASVGIAKQISSQLAVVPSILSGMLMAIGPAIGQGIQALTARFLDLPVGGQLTAVAIGAAGAFFFFNTAIGQTVLALGGLTLKAIPVAIGAITGIGNAIIGLSGAAVAGFAGLTEFVFLTLPALASAGWASIVAGIGSLVTALTSLSLGSIWSALVGGVAAAGSAILAFAGTVATTGIALLANPIVLGIGAIALAAGLIYKYWEPITHFFQGFVSGLMSALAPLMPALVTIGGAIATVFSPLIGLFKMAWDWLTRLLTPVKDTDGAARNLGETFGKVVGSGIMTAVNAIKTMIDWLEQGVNKLKGFLGMTSQATSGLSMATNFQIPGTFTSPTPTPSAPVVPRYSGQIGTAATGFIGNLLSAARVEMAAMPSGAQLVVANTSESIVPRGGLGQVAAAAVSGATSSAVPARGNTINLSLTINAGSGDANAIAQAAVNAIQRMFESELSTQLG